MNSEKVTYLGKAEFRGKSYIFGLKPDDRTRHTYIIGKTGMGKSTLLENMAVQDILNGEGLCFIDPHGSTAEKLLEYIPEHRVKDVMYLAPFDHDFPFGLNVLEKVEASKRHLVANGLMAAFKKIFKDQFSARMEYILNNIILCLLENDGQTLLGVNRMLVDKEYRKAMVANVTDPMIKDFWTKEYANYTDTFAKEVAPAIQNKVGQFIANPLIRNIIGQKKTSFDLRWAMDNKKIVIMNLSKGRIGEGNANLIGNLLITKIYLASMSRADVGQAALKELPRFYFYVDEFQNFANDTFANILSEARKYNLALTVAHQYVEQMEDEVKAAVFGNVGTMITFRVGATDAEQFEKEFAPYFTADDIVNLSQYQIYLRLMIDGVASKPFSAMCMPPIKAQTRLFIDETIEWSRKTYCQNVAIVEAEVEEFYKPVAPPIKADSDKPKNEFRTPFVSASNSSSGNFVRDDRDTPRRDAPKRDEVRREEPRRDSISRDSPRRDEFRREEASRRDASRRDEPRRDAVSRDSPRRDEFRREEASRRDAPRRDELRANDVVVETKNIGLATALAAATAHAVEASSVSSVVESDTLLSPTVASSVDSNVLKSESIASGASVLVGNNIDKSKAGESELESVAALTDVPSKAASVSETKNNESSNYQNKNKEFVSPFDESSLESVVKPRASSVAIDEVKSVERTDDIVLDEVPKEVLQRWVETKNIDSSDLALGVSKSYDVNIDEPKVDLSNVKVNQNSDAVVEPLIRLEEKMVAEKDIPLSSHLDAFDVKSDELKVDLTSVAAREISSSLGEPLSVLAETKNIDSSDLALGVSKSHDVNIDEPKIDLSAGDASKKSDESLLPSGARTYSNDGVLSEVKNEKFVAPVPEVEYFASTPVSTSASSSRSENIETETATEIANDLISGENNDTRKESRYVSNLKQRLEAVSQNSERSVETKNISVGAEGVGANSGLRNTDRPGNKERDNRRNDERRNASREFFKGPKGLASVMPKIDGVEDVSVKTSHVDNEGVYFGNNPRTTLKDALANAVANFENEKSKHVAGDVHVSAASIAPEISKRFRVPEGDVAILLENYRKYKAKKAWSNSGRDTTNDDSGGGTSGKADSTNRNDAYSYSNSYAGKVIREVPEDLLKQILEGDDGNNTK